MSFLKLDKIFSNILSQTSESLFLNASFLKSADLHPNKLQKSNTMAVDQVTIFNRLHLLLWRHLFQSRYMLLSSKRKRNLCVYMHVIVFRHT